jgi:hypothetical protein
MAKPAVRIVLSRDHFRQLVAGGEAVFHAPTQRIHVVLNLESGSDFGKYTDPVEASEYHRKKEGKNDHY